MSNDAPNKPPIDDPETPIDEPRVTEVAPRPAKRWLPIAGIALGALLLGGGYLALRAMGGLGETDSTAGSTPTHAPDTGPPPTFEPPPSLGSVVPIEELAKQYPTLVELAKDPRIASTLKDFAAAYERGGLDGARAYARDKGFMNDEGDLTLTILLDTGADVPALEKELVAQRSEIIAKRDQEIDIRVPAVVLEETVRTGKAPEAALRKLAAAKGVRGVVPTVPMLPDDPPDGPGPRREEHGTLGGASPRDGPPLDGSLFETNQARGTHGSTISEGIRLTSASAWHAAGHRGAGIRVGVLDPEVSHTQRHLGRTIPADTEVFLGACVNRAGAAVDDDGIHGVAAAEIIHEMAPDARLYIACSLGNTQASIDWLVAQGVRIISFSAGGMLGPRDGTGAMQSVIDRLAARNILWVNSSGNEGKTTHRGQLRGGNGVHTFTNGRASMCIQVRRKTKLRATLIWSDWNPTLSDYDLFLHDRAGRVIDRAQNKNTVLRQPVERIVGDAAPGQYFVSIQGSPGARPATFILNVSGAAIELPVSQGSLAAPGDARGAFTVGAVDVLTGALAPYSSQGPTEDGRIKPDISAPANTRSDLYSAFGGRFTGTSAACPHVAGAAALVWGRNPSWRRDDVANFLTSRARDLPPVGADPAHGAGYLDLGPATAVASTPPVSGAPTPLDPRQPPTVPRAEDDGRSGDGSPGAGVILLILAIMALGALVLAGGLIYVVYRLVKPRSRAAPPPYPQGRLPHSAPQQPARLYPGPHLVGLSGPFQSRGLPLGQRDVVFGRQPPADVVIAEPRVSAVHARIVFQQGAHFVIDQSRNGTWVNNERIVLKVLVSGDVISIGSSHFRFVI